jgi:hypothetical protein
MRRHSDAGMLLGGGGGFTPGSQSDDTERRGARMLAGSGFGRWGFILGNVLMAFGAPVSVTSLISVVANNRDGLPARREDIAAIAAGAAFVLAGLLLAVLAGRQARPARTAPPQRSAYRSYTPAALRHRDSLGGRSRSIDVTGNLDLNFGLDDYYNQRGGGLALDDTAGVPAAPARGQAEVPPQRTPSGGYRNSRHWLGVDRFHQPTITGMRSSGTRRRPPGG